MATIRPIPAGATLGKGVDAEMGESYGYAIIYDPPTSLIDDQPLGQRVRFNLQQITSSVELSKMLNVSASASVGFGLFSASAEVNYAQQQSVNQYSTYLLVSVEVKNPTLMMRNPRFKPEIFQLLAERGWDWFENHYGPEYMAGVVTGGSYYGLIEIKTLSKQEQQAIAVAVSASYGLFKASGSLDLKLKQAIENKELKITVLQSGGSGDPVETTLEEMITQAKNFPKLVKDHPVEFQGIFEEYRKTVPLPSAVGESIFSRAHRLAVMEELGLKYWSCKDYRANLCYVLDNFYGFEDHLVLTPEEQTAKKARYQKDFEDVSEQLNELQRRAKACRASFNACELPTSYFVATEPLPEFSEGNMMLKQLEEQLAKVREQVNVLQSAVNPDENGDIRVSGKVIADDGFQAKRGDWLLRSNGNDLEIREPEQGNQVWAKFNDGKNLHLMGTPDLLVNGKVGIGTTKPKGKLDVNGSIRVRGGSAMVLRKYTGNRVNTRFSTRDWIATIAGFRALGGDVQEHDRGDIVQVYPYERDNRWWYFADFRSHANRHETWEVWMLFIRRELF